MYSSNGRHEFYRVHFDRFGQKFGAGDMKGNLCLWRFDTSSQASKPYWVGIQVFSIGMSQAAFHNHLTFSSDLELPFKSYQRLYFLGL